ncbi:MAG: Prohead core protein serine protease [Phycisphaerales bacterium]|nr:Prohead core protein serine protease [Phycisphaerales bacterium]
MNEHWLDVSLAQVVERGRELPPAGPAASVGEAIADIFGFETVRAENAALRHGGNVREAAAASVARPAGGKRYTVKIGECDRPTANSRLYPRSEWAAAVDRANAEQCPGGFLGGAIDHAGPLDGGSSKHRCLIWRGLELRADGDVYGTFEIVAGHSDGKNLLAWVAAGGGLAFSTFGTARSRPPTGAERRQYGLAESDDVVVMEQYRLVAVDVVDNPGVAGAVMHGGRQG